VARNPAGKPDAYGRQLLPADPHAGQAPHAARVDPEIGRCPDQNIFKIPDVSVHVAPVRLQVQDGVTNDLAGPMVRNISATPGLVDLDTARSKDLGAGEDVRSSPVAAHAQGEDVWMLHEEQQVVNVAIPALIYQGALKREGVPVRHQTETADGERSRQH
jgi:hypothetical protein